MINFSNKFLPECRSWKEAGQEGRDGEKSWGGGGMDLKDWTMGPSSWNPNISSLLLAVKGQAIWLQELAKKGTEPGHKLNYQLQWGWCLSSDTFNSLAVWELQPSEALPASEVLQAFTLPRLPRHPAPPLLLFTEDSAKQTFPPAAPPQTADPRNSQRLSCAPARPSPVSQAAAVWGAQAARWEQVWVFLAPAGKDNVGERQSTCQGGVYPVLTSGPWAKHLANLLG